MKDQIPRKSSGWVLCTRPRLAAMIQNAGLPIKPTTNPFFPTRAAWLYELSGEVKPIVAEYYRQEDARKAAIPGKDRT